MAPGALDRGRRLVGALGAEVYAPAAHPPQLEAARPADLVELEVRFVARVAVVPAPDLRGGAGVPYERRDLAARATTEIGRASCRERVEISVVAVALKKKRKRRRTSRYECVADT